MDKSKWQSKLVHMGVTLALVLSLLGIAVLPVVAQTSFGNVSIAVDGDDFCCCDNFVVNVTVTAGAVNATNLTGVLVWDGDANIVTGPTPASQNLSPRQTGYIEWTVHCNGPDDARFRATVSAVNYTPETVQSDWVTQDSGFLEVVNVTVPAEVSVCNCFNVSFQFQNTGCANMTDVFGWLQALDEAEFGCPPDTHSQITTNFLKNEAGGDILEPGDKTELVTVQMHCTGTDEGGIHIIPYGNDACGNEIVGKSDISRWEQVFEVVCNATAVKLCFNTTFTAEIGVGALYPVNYTWSFGDGNSTSGQTSSSPIVVYHHYNSTNPDPGFHACINVTDTSGTTVQCCADAKVYPELEVACNVSSNITKVGHNVTFNGTAIGGFPADACNFTWTWDFGDGNSTGGIGRGPNEVSYHYNATDNYTATYTLTDDCLNNTANCTVPVRVYPPLSANCTVSSNVTKVSHNVTFYGDAVGGFPDTVCNYSWNWTFGDGNSTSGIGRSSNVSYHYAATDNYTATFTIRDDCLNNTATCNSTVRVFPGIEVACNATPRVQHICHAVNFTANVTGGIPGSNFTYEWNFGDPFATPGNPNTSTEQNPSHTYMCTGNFTANVTVCDDQLEQNCANCSVNVTIYIEPPELIRPPQNAQLTSKNVTFEWEDIGCVNYTLVVHQKDNPDTKVLIVNVGKNSTYTGILFNHNWGWYVIGMDICGEWVISDTWYFQVDAPDTGVIVLSPNGGELWAPMSQQSITWAASPTDGEISIEYSSDGGASWNPVASGLVNDGAEPWSVPDIESDQCLVKVIVNDPSAGSAQDTSDDLFTIGAAPTVTVISPNGGESYIGGSTQNITWNATDNVGVTSVDLYLSSDGGTHWAVIAVGEDNDGTYNWTVPGINSDQCLVKVEASDAIGLVGSDTSDAVFAIATDETYPDVTVTTPNGGETWTGCTEEMIVWVATEYGTLEGGVGVNQEDLDIDLSYSADQGVTWTVIATGELNDGAYLWTVPAINSDQCLVRVEATDPFSNTGTDTSNDVFTIATGVRVFIPDTGISPNSTAVVPIHITGVTDVAAVDIWLTYDTSVVMVLNVTDGTLGTITSLIDNANSTTKMNYFDVTGQTGDFIFAYVELQAVGSGGETSPLDLDVKAMFDSDGDPICHTTEDGVFSVLTLMRGDANLDGCISIVDAMFVAQNAFGLRTFNADQTLCSEVDNTPPVTIIDAMFIAQYLVGARDLDFPAALDKPVLC